MSQINTNAILDASGGTSTTVNGYTPTASNMAGRNRIINGDMRIDQRGSATTPVTTSGYVNDRWYQGSPVVSKISSQQSTTAPAGYLNSFASTVSSAYTPASGEVFRFLQKIEGLNCVDLAFGSASAKTVTLSFWVRSSVTGTYAVSVQNSGNTRSYVATYTVTSANTWEYKAITIAGDQSGTWLTTSGTGIQVAFCQQTGSNFQTTAGSWQSGEYYGVSGAASWLPTAGATFYITGVQLEEGSVATPFEHRQYGQELALCQRYCYVLPTAVQYPGATCFTTNRVLGAFSCATTFRATPTVTAASNSVYFFTNAAASLSSSTAITASIQGTVSVDITATATQGASGVISTNSQIVISAEL